MHASLKGKALLFILTALSMSRFFPNEVTRDEIKDERFGYTTVTAWWGDGTPGPLVIIVGEAHYKPKIVEKLNAEYAGECFVMSSGKQSHFADAQNNILMFEEVYGPAFALRRSSKGYALNVPGVLLYDAFTGFEAEATEARQAMVITTQRCYIYL